MNIRFFFSLLLLFVFFTNLKAQTIWQGGSSQYWQDENNWRPDIVPGQNDDVIIPASAGVIYYAPTTTTVKSIDIADESHLVIEQGGVLTIENSSSFGIKIRNKASVENHGELILLASAYSAIDLYTDGILENYGLLSVIKATRRGIYSRGTFTNFEGGGINIQGSQDYGITQYGGTFTNAGDIRFVEKYDGKGLYVGNSAIFENQETGRIYLEENSPTKMYVQGSTLINDGLIDIKSDAVYPGAIYLNTSQFDNTTNGVVDIGGFSGYSGIAIAANSHVENDGYIKVRKYGGSSFVNGIWVYSGTFYNKHNGEVYIRSAPKGIYVSSSSADACVNRGLMTFESCNSAGIYNLGEFTNYNEIVFDRCHGIRNESRGVFSNDRGTITALGSNYYAIKNNNRFTNRPCSEISVEGRIINYTSNFNNYGYMNCPVDGADFSGNDINNYGIILDPFDRFLPILNNEVVYINMLDDFDGVYLANVLDLEDWGDYSMDEYWYFDQPFTYDNEAGIYDESFNDILLWDDLEHPFYYAVFTYNPTGCTTVVEVPIDPALLNSFGESPPNNNAADRSKNQTGTTASVDLQVFPNPSTGLLTINIDKAPSDELEVRLLDVNGRTIWTKENIKTSTLNLDLTQEVSTGIYLLQVLQNGKPLHSKRLVMQMN